MYHKGRYDGLKLELATHRYQLAESLKKAANMAVGGSRIHVCLASVSWFFRSAPSAVFNVNHFYSKREGRGDPRVGSLCYTPAGLGVGARKRVPSASV
jgi:hypothetical protein